MTVRCKNSDSINLVLIGRYGPIKGDSHQIWGIWEVYQNSPLR